MLSCSHLKQHSETSLSLYFGDAIEVDLAAETSVEIAVFAEHLRSSLPSEHILEIIPSYTSIFIEWDILNTTNRELEKAIRTLLSEYRTPDLALSRKTIELPVFYHPEVAPDLAQLATTKGLSIDEVILFHSQQTYTVASIGFAPGFAYLAGLDQRLATPRQPQPKKVLAGSLGIADDQTAIYPNESPGGWNIIGNCPLPLFDLEKEPMTPFTVGDQVRFTPITKEEFQRHQNNQ